MRQSKVKGWKTVSYAVGGTKKVKTTFFPRLKDARAYQKTVTKITKSRVPMWSVKERPIPPSLLKRTSRY